MKIMGASIIFVLLLFSSPAKAATTIPFDGYLVLDGNDDIATANVSAPTGDEITIEAFFLLKDGSSSPIDKLHIVSNNQWTLYVIRYSIGNTRTGCIGYLGPGGWEHCRTSTIGLNVWHHLAFTVKNGQGQFYLNGKVFGSPHAVPTPTLSGILNVGNHLNGNLDELRISENARYNSDFVVPFQKYQCDNSTLTLWGFDEPEGSTAFSDRCRGHSLVGQNGAYSAGGPVLAFKVYLPHIAK